MGKYLTEVLILKNLHFIKDICGIIFSPQFILISSSWTLYILPSFLQRLNYGTFWENIKIIFSIGWITSIWNDIFILSQSDNYYFVCSIRVSGRLFRKLGGKHTTTIHLPIILHVPVYIVISGHYELATRFPFLISHALDRSMYNYIYMKYVMMMYMIYYIWISSWFMMLNGDGVSYDSCRRNFTGTRCAIPNPNIREFSDGMVSDVFPPFIQAPCIDYQHRMSCSFWVYSDFSPANYFFFHI